MSYETKPTAIRPRSQPPRHTLGDRHTDPTTRRLPPSTHPISRRRNSISLRHLGITRTTRPTIITRGICTLRSRTAPSPRTSWYRRPSGTVIVVRVCRCMGGTRSISATCQVQHHSTWADAEAPPRDSTTIRAGTVTDARAQTSSRIPRRLPWIGTITTGVQARILMTVAARSIPATGAITRKAAMKYGRRILCPPCPLCPRSRCLWCRVWIPTWQWRSPLGFTTTVDRKGGKPSLCQAQPHLLVAVRC